MPLGYPLSKQMITVFTTVSAVVSAISCGLQEAGAVTATDNRGWSALVYAVASGRTAIVDAMVSLIERSVPPEQVRV